MDSETGGKSQISYGLSVPSSTKPVFDRLDWTSSNTHLVVADTYGVTVLERLFSADEIPDLSAVSVLVYNTDQHTGARIANKGLEDVTVLSDEASLVAAMREKLLSTTMETHLYIAAEHAFLGRIAEAAYACGIAAQSLTAETCGPSTRSAQCAHCKHVAKVDRRAYVCPACHLTLSVRDHYSKRIGAYQAVIVTAPEERLDLLKSETL
jgi:hypothetical protein